MSVKTRMSQRSCGLLADLPVAQSKYVGRPGGNSSVPLSVERTKRASNGLGSHGNGQGGRSLFSGQRKGGVWVRSRSVSFWHRRRQMVAFARKSNPRVIE
jgi:hypothetical protein